MKKIITLFFTLILASSTFTSCESKTYKSDKADYAKVLSDAYDGRNELDLEKFNSCIYPKEIVDLKDKLGELEVSEEDKASYTQDQMFYKLDGVKEKEVMTEAQLSLTEKYLAEVKFDLEYLLIDNKDILPNNYYGDGINNAEPFCDVTKGYLITLEAEQSRNAEILNGDSKAKQNSPEIEEFEGDIFVYYIDGEGWKVDYLNQLYYYFERQNGQADS